MNQNKHLVSTDQNNKPEQSVTITPKSASHLAQTIKLIKRNQTPDFAITEGLFKTKEAKQLKKLH